MNPEMARATNHIPSMYLYMAIELSNQQWKLGFTVGFGQAPRLRNLPARDLKGLAEEIDRAYSYHAVLSDKEFLSANLEEMKKEVGIKP